MTQTCEKPPPGGQENGFSSGMSSAGCCFDTSEIKPPRPNTQIKFQEPAEAEFDAEAFERLLAIKRRSLWAIGCECSDQIAFMLGALQYADDDAAFDHCKEAVANFRAIARLANDLRLTAQGAGL